MVRITASVARKKRKKRVLKKTKGQFGFKSKRFREAKRSLNKGQGYAYRDRKVKKREIKSVWIIRINAACRANGISYSRFIKGLSLAKVEMNRKMLADLAATSPDAFLKLVKIVLEVYPYKNTPKVKTAKAKTSKA